MKAVSYFFRSATALTFAAVAATAALAPVRAESVPQAAESDGVDDPVAVALEQVARTAGRPILFCEGPAARL